MDDLEFASADNTNNNVQAECPQNTSRGSGLRLIIPSLKTIQALKGKKKGKGASQDVTPATPVPKVPRPVKLKPLKEVLTKLISQIKKKDDYAFFLTPVDVSLIPGYGDVIQQPMDLGTMSTKVEKGRYRSLEEFATDLRLVTGNAKIFNPPGTIYHSEADRIEAYALAHITKATATVIEYETDWNVDVENEGEPVPNVGDEEDGSNRARSPSAASTTTPMVGSARQRSSKSKKKAGMLSESVEDDGHMPGHKDGVGVFPVESEFSDLMLALKLKGKRYRTKKERIRMERGGPPFHVDGSLDYPEMEDPFSILSIFLPEPLTKPQLTPIFWSATPSDPSQLSLPSSVNVPPRRSRPHSQPQSPTIRKSPYKNRTGGKRKHWTITRVTSSRRAKDANEEEPQVSSPVPREPQHVDYGSFTTLLEQLAEESQMKYNASDLTSPARLLEVVRESVDKNLSDYSLTVPPSLDPKLGDGGDYWKQKAAQAEDYIRDMVYGGVEGLAYIRSLAAFIHHDNPKMEDATYDSLGMPLADWVAQNIVDPSTDGRHYLLRETVRHLHSPSHSLAHPELASYIDRSLRLLPKANQDLASLRELSNQLLDMAALIKKPDELFAADDAWEGAVYMEEQRKRLEVEHEKALAESPEKNAADYLAFAIQSHREAEAATKTKTTFEGPDVLLHALQWSAAAIEELAKKSRGEVEVETTGSKQVDDGDDDAMDIDEVIGKEEKSTASPIEEDPHMRKLRLNLLALSKRAPLDKVARLPVGLVPVHIRHVIPTLDSAS